MSDPRYVRLAEVLTGFSCELKSERMTDSGINSGYYQFEVRISAQRENVIIRAPLKNDRVPGKGNEIWGLSNIDHGAIVP